MDRFSTRVAGDASVERTVVLVPAPISAARGATNNHSEASARAQGGQAFLASV